MKNLEINPVYFPVMQSSKFYKVLYGGRGSGKSYFVSDFLVLLLLNKKNRNLLALRKTKVHARASVFIALINSISKMGLEDVVKINHSTMTITFPNRNQIRCEGLDNTANLKSMMFLNGRAVSDVWFEEAEQLTKKELDDISFSIRGAKKPQIILTFNPINKNMWIYTEFMEKQKDNALVLRTSYLDNKFIDKEFIERMKQLEKDDPELYKVVGLGMFGNVEGIVYKNYVVDRLTAPDTWYDTILWGLDFGHVEDPMALLKVGIKDGTIYILDEIVAKKINSSVLADLMLESNVPMNALLESDHNKEAQSVLYSRGFQFIRNAKKTEKEKWVEALSYYNIVVNDICSETLKEIGTYKWITDPSGKCLFKLRDGNDHCMDALIYACRPWMETRVMKPMTPYWRKK